jgi:hypothetical protein
LGLKASFTEGKVMEQLSVDIAAKVQWSDWTHCESSFNLVLVPHLPGVYALAEEVTEFVGENDEDWQSLSPQERELAARVQLLVPEPIRKRRKLMIFVINETGNLAYAISSLFSLGNPVGEHLAHSQCYVRYAVIEDAEQRHAVYSALQMWLALDIERNAARRAAAAGAQAKKKEEPVVAFQSDASDADQFPRGSKLS